jgi:hypothetical protein
VGQLARELGAFVAFVAFVPKALKSILGLFIYSGFLRERQRHQVSMRAVCFV